jgi:serine/threonine protein kinase
MGQAGVICRNCGTVNSPQDQFCSNCGYELAGSNVGSYPQSSTGAPTVGSASGRRSTGALAIGSLLSGRYQIVQLMGKGGFGAVYKALDERFQGQRMVAIKEMSDAQLNPSEKAKALQDFRREADLLVSLNHPNLPNVSDFFEEGGKAYLVMEFIEGETLETKQEEAGSPLDEALVMGWALQLCNVLHYLHTRSRPIIFRDMKPSNVMVTSEREIKLIDFGIARFLKQP